MLHQRSMQESDQGCCNGSYEHAVRAVAGASGAVVGRENLQLQCKVQAEEGFSLSFTSRTERPYLLYTLILSCYILELVKDGKLAATCTLWTQKII